MSEHLLWARYLTGVCVFIPNLEGNERAFTEYLFARGDDFYWGPKISYEIFREGINPDISNIDTSNSIPNFAVTGEDNDVEALEKKRNALKKIQEVVDEYKEDIGDGVYLKIMNLMKEVWS